jgi:hypothetical protein
MILMDVALESDRLGRVHQWSGCGGEADGRCNRVMI